VSSLGTGAQAELQDSAPEPTVPSPVCVTGASGFIASWIVKTFLEAGVTVHGTVRDTAREDRTRPLEALAEGTPGTLELFDADLLEPGSFGPAVAGCEAVIHCASPFFVAGVRDGQQQLVEPALRGTRHLLDAVEETSTVKRVVVTSSVVAVYGDAKDIEDMPADVFTEEHWNRTSSPSHQPYSYSKTVAERAAWERAEDQDRWDLVTILPSFVLGPSLTGRLDGTSTDTVLQLLDGRMKSGAPDLRFGMVDVRDVARAHVEAIRRGQASGRYIVSAESRSFPDLALVLREKYGDRFPIPKSVVPKPMLYVLAPFVGFSWKFVRRNVGIDVRFDNGRSQRELGISYRPVREALLDQAERLIELGAVRTE